MTNDEMERNMEFIVEHQAKFSVEIDKINQVAAKNNEEAARLLGLCRTLLRPPGAGGSEGGRA